MIHTVKCTPEYFAALLDGRKNAEIRKNDRPYRVGDFLAVNEFGACDPSECVESDVRCADGGVYSGRCALFKITYIISDPKYLPNDMVVLCLQPCYKSE